MARKPFIVESGNAWDLSARGSDGIPNGWFMGSSRFITNSSLRQSEHVELKWSKYQAGFDSGVKVCSPFLTISVLVQGQFEIDYREAPDSPWHTFRMERPGDFVIVRGGWDHVARSGLGPEDTVLFTVRVTVIQD